MEMAAWIAFEHSKVSYTYFETDPYSKPPELLEISPRGLVPALKLQHGKALAESTIIMEYIGEWGFVLS